MSWNLAFHGLLQQLIESRTPFVMVTLVDVLLSAPQEVGAKLLVTSQGLFGGTIGGGKLEAAAIRESLSLLACEGSPPQIVNRNMLMRLNLKGDLGMTCGGEVSLFFEAQLYSQWKIAIFGAGHVSQALVRVLLSLECQLTVIDERQDWLDKLPQDPKLTKVCLTPLAAFVPKLAEDTFVISMTQGHSHDLPVIHAVLDGWMPPYLGVIGSDSKARVIKRDLKGLGVPEDRIQQIRCPIGLTLGSRSPNEIAISIAAQLLMVRGG